MFGHTCTALLQQLIVQPCFAARLLAKESEADLTNIRDTHIRGRKANLDLSVSELVCGEVVYVVMATAEDASLH